MIRITRNCTADSGTCSSTTSICPTKRWNTTARASAPILTTPGCRPNSFRAVARRDLIYRLFSLPSRTFTWLCHVLTVVRLQPWRLLLLMIAFKLVGIFLLWLLAATVILWPGGKAYEWLQVKRTINNLASPKFFSDQSRPSTPGSVKSGAGEPTSSTGGKESAARIAPAEAKSRLSRR